MKYFLIINVWTLPFSIFLFSCSDNQTTYEQWTTDAVEPREIEKLIAGYDDGDGISFILRYDSASDRALKVTRISGYPDVIDTLIRTDTNLFKSLRHSTLFSIQDSSVTITFYQKIIHPSSNWQGQTPWQETIVSSYPRRDLRLK